MTYSKPLPKNEANDVKAWDLPFVEDVNKEALNQKTNALNKRSDWKYEPPEVEEEILPPTAEEIEAIRQAAYEEGYNEGKQLGFDDGRAAGFEEGKEAGQQEGFEEGKQQGLDAGTEEISQLAENWKTLASHLHKPLNQANSDTRQQLVHLAVALARAVIRTEVNTNENVVLQALSEGLKVLPINEKMYQMHMHPDDIALVRERFDDTTIAENSWHFVASPGMSRGGCDITSSKNAVDVSIERRCRDVLDQFLLDQGLGND